MIYHSLVYCEKSIKKYNADVYITLWSILQFLIFMDALLWAFSLFDVLL